MPTAVKMYVKLPALPTMRELDSLRIEFMQAMGLTEEDFYVAGPLIVVPIDDYRYMPENDDDAAWLEVNLWKAYYRPGYERGNPELFVRCAEWLEQRFTGAAVYYGHDVDAENVSLFDREAQESMLAYYRKR